MILLFLSIPLIACVDYFLFRKWTKCNKCGNQINEWYGFLIPTFVEILLFLGGVAIGMTLLLR